MLAPGIAGVGSRWSFDLDHGGDFPFPLVLPLAPPLALVLVLDGFDRVLAGLVGWLCGVGSRARLGMARGCESGTSIGPLCGDATLPIVPCCHLWSGGHVAMS
jgi:hypothetical protein